MKISELKLNKKNPRFIKDDKFNKLLKSIKDFPKMMELRPIVIDDENTILGGNMRYRALRELGYKEIPKNWVKKASDLSEEQKKEFIIKDNVSYGGWDWDILANEWDADLLEESGIEIQYETNIDNDIDLIADFNESVNFIISCKNLEELELLKSKLGVTAVKIDCFKFLEIIKKCK